LTWKVSYLSELGEEVGRLRCVGADLAEGEGNEHGDQEVGDREVKERVLRQPAPPLHTTRTTGQVPRSTSTTAISLMAPLISFTRYILLSLLVLQTGRDRDSGEDHRTNQQT
jgi:hypothetical protein